MSETNREEIFLSAMAGEYTGNLPEPINRKEMYLKKCAENSGHEPVAVFTGANSAKGGTAGLVPAPRASSVTKVLQSNGVWGIPAVISELSTYTVYPNATQTMPENGLVAMLIVRDDSTHSTRVYMAMTGFYRAVQEIASLSSGTNTVNVTFSVGQPFTMTNNGSNSISWKMFHFPM